MNARVLARLEAGWHDFLRAIEAVPAEDLTRPGVLDEWSVRDLLVHISSWEREFIKALPLILEDERRRSYSAT